MRKLEENELVKRCIVAVNYYTTPGHVVEDNLTVLVTLSFDLNEAI